MKTSGGRRTCDLIVMACTEGRGLEGFLLGSETQKVLTHTSYRCWSTAERQSAERHKSAQSSPHSGGAGPRACLPRRFADPPGQTAVKLLVGRTGLSVRIHSDSGPTHIYGPRPAFPSVASCVTPKLLIQPLT